MTRKPNAIPGGSMLPLERLKREHTTPVPKTPEPSLFGMGLLGPIVPRSRGLLSKRFLIPPFSVLDARAGYWQDRKRAWLAMGIKSELGRGEHGVQEGGVATAVSQKLAPGGGGCWAGGPKTTSSENYQNRGRLTYVAGNRPVEDLDDVSKKILEAGSGTSIFDPVLCECVYRWFSPPGGQVLDPFAGGSVRGIVAAELGRRYLGVDLGKRQVEANRQQRGLVTTDIRPKWKCGDSAVVVPTLDIEADLVFSCPPYADLERYSDDPRDLSTMGYKDFVAIYRKIIEVSLSKLKPNRFACFVVGDLRDTSRGGIYRNFPGDTISAFQDAGAMLYNEFILVTAVGSLPIRTGKQFASGRKAGKTHQNVLVFVKGDPKEAASACGEL